MSIQHRNNKITHKKRYTTKHKRTHTKRYTTKHKKRYTTKHKIKLRGGNITNLTEKLDDLINTEKVSKEEVKSDQYGKCLQYTHDKMKNIDLFSKSAATRIMFYKYIRGEIDFNEINKYLPGISGIDITLIKELWDLVFNMPKGSTHHEHYYSIGHTINFIKYLIDNLPSKYAIVYIYNLIPLKDNPHMKWAANKSLRLVTTTFINSLDIDTFNTSLFLVTNKECTTQIKVVSYASQILTTDSINIEIDTSGRNIISTMALVPVIYITPDTENIYRGKEWDYLEFCASRFWQVISNEDVLPLYLTYIAEKAKEEKIQDVQIKYNITCWKYGTDNTYIDIYQNETLRIVSAIIDSLFEKTNVSIHFIYGLQRMPKIDNPTNKEKQITNVLNKFRSARNLENDIPNINRKIIGYDIFGEEDKSNRTDMYYHKLVEFYNESPATTAFMIHSGETNEIKYPVNDNLLLAYTLPGSIRIGHGISLWKYPELMKKIAGKICIELCPLSNSVLGYIPDPRNHPAIAYINQNIDVSINTDNRGLLNYEFVTYDWFDLIVALLLPYEVIVNIARSSIKYSSRINDINDEIYERWLKDYKVYIS